MLNCKWYSFAINFLYSNSTSLILNSNYHINNMASLKSIISWYSYFTEHKDNDFWNSLLGNFLVWCSKLPISLPCWCKDIYETFFYFSSLWQWLFISYEIILCLYFETISIYIFQCLFPLKSISVLPLAKSISKLYSQVPKQKTFVMGRNH
jgi:hypothetical protein